MTKQTDISTQIQKYLNGELDAKAMHRLEREALNDPFLADALEGYAGVKANQQGNLADIAARLQSRTQAKVKRLIPWKVISVAASVIVVLTIGGLWMLNNNGGPQVQQEKVAMLDKAKVSKPRTQLPAASSAAVAEKETLSAPPVAEQRVAALKKTRKAYIQQAEANAEITIEEPSLASASPPVMPARKDTVALEDRVMNGFFNTDTSKPQTVAAVRPVETALQGRVPGVSVTQIGKNITPNQFIDGRVTDNGIPLPGATVKVKGTNVMAQTDAEGKFKVPADKEKTELEISSLGYLSQSVAAKEHDSLLIAMQPSKESLSEVVVVAYGAKKRVKSKAMPSVGWTAYKKYLEEGAKSPDGKKGTVKLSFTVTPDWEVENFKILNSVSPQTDAAAIKLVEEGANWQPNSNGKPEVVTISIKFTP